MSNVLGNTKSSHSHMASPSLRDLTRRFVGEGRIEAILLRPARLEPMTSVLEVEAEPGRGLIGDRRSLSLRTGELAQKREVTLYQAEHLPVIASWLGLQSLEPARLRRNLVVSGINLSSMRSPFADVQLEWQFGERVILEVTGSCDPCSRMESELGQGGYNALRGHGGMTARVLVGGTIRVSDSVRLRAVEQRV
ncbi:MAG: MOSC domain-containing protein [Caldimonas sp.]